MKSCHCKDFGYTFCLLPDGDCRICDYWYDRDEKERDKKKEMENNKPVIVQNHPCLCCLRVKGEMVLLGVLFFCESCFEKEFHTKNPIKEEKEKYLAWLRVKQRKER